MLTCANAPRLARRSAGSPQLSASAPGFVAATLRAQVVTVTSWTCVYGGLAVLETS
jgi:hypothetical protein